MCAMRSYYWLKSVSQFRYGRGSSGMEPLRIDDGGSNFSLKPDPLVGFLSTFFFCGCSYLRKSAFVRGFISPAMSASNSR